MVFLLFILKPKFVICTGVGWSATTPLWYTLQVSNQFIHAGVIKESGYLYNISDTKRNLLKKRITRRIETEKQIEKKLFKKRIPEVTKDIYLTEEERLLIHKAPFSFQRYIAYYKRLWETLQENNCPYQGVADFSNKNGWIPPEYLPNIIQQLSVYFDVKALIVVRDPIRRLWSEVNAFHFLNDEDPLPSFEIYEKLFLERVGGYQQSQYFSIIDKWEKVCPYHVIIMEQLWEGENQEREKQRLSDFLEYDIKNIHQNAYCPDRGPNAPMHLGLRDQYTSDKYFLPDKLYDQFKPLMPIYQQWVDRYGSLPLYWGKPYNYSPSNVDEL